MQTRMEQIFTSDPQAMTTLHSTSSSTMTEVSGLDFCITTHEGLLLITIWQLISKSSLLMHSLENFQRLALRSETQTPDLTGMVMETSP